MSGPTQIWLAGILAAIGVGLLIGLAIGRTTARRQPTP